MILATAPSFHEMLNLIREYFEGVNRAIPRIKWSHLVYVYVRAYACGCISERERENDNQKFKEFEDVHYSLCVFK